MMTTTNDGDTKGYASVSAQLESWTSPRVGKMSSKNWRTYEENADQWMETSMGGGAGGRGSAASASSLTPQKRPARDDDSPETPVMSNSAHKTSDRESISTFDLMTVPKFMQPITTASDEYRLYHDALLRYVQGSQRSSAAEVELTYLSTLATDSSNPLWSLLCKFRGLGMEALWMDDSEMAKRQQQMALSDTLLRLSSTTVVTTHAQLLKDLYGEKSTLLMQRRKALMEWMQECAAKKQPESIKMPKPATQMWPDSHQALKQGMTGKIASLDPDAPLLVSESGEPLFGKDPRADEELLQACLQYILAGRLDKAMELCRNRGQPWRAAVWQGGRPLDVSTVSKDDDAAVSTVVSTGNPGRLLWKSQCRKLARKTSGTESAIYALLSNDMESALTNPALRSWEDALYAIASSLVGRMEDELLHRYHAQLRKSGRIFPGSDYEQEEMEHLLSTAGAARLNESTIFDKLAASPYKALHGNSLDQKLVAAFVKGKSAVMTLLRSPWFQEKDATRLRSMTHLLLYLDSSFAPGLEHIKEDCIQHYLRHLAGRPDLVKFTTVYASMLSPQTMFDVLPGLLTSVQVPEERNLIWRQMKNLLGEGSDIILLQRIVRLILGDKDVSDVRKCQSIGWLCFTRDHYEQALVCANELVRQLLLNDEADVASKFLWEYFPTIVQEDSYDAFVSAKREHDALLVFLEANTSFGIWKDCMMDTEPESSASTLDQTKLNAAEKEIARSMEKRRLIEEKRELAQKVISIATAAQVKLEEVLTFDGGWLQEYEEDDEVDNPEEVKRQEELGLLQSRTIPQVVFYAHNVYTETATFMKTMLEDAVPTVGKDAKEVLMILDEVEDGSLSPFAPLYWLKQAHALANKVASEEYSVYDSFDEDALKHFLSLMEDVTIKVLLESAP